MTARTGSVGASSTAGEAYARRLGAVYDLADAIARAVPLEALFEKAVEAVREALGVKRAALLVTDEAGVMRFRSWRGLSDGYRAAAEGHSPWARDEERPSPLVIEDVADDESLGELRTAALEEGIGALAFVPLVAGGRLAGKLVLCHDGPYAYGELELNLAATLAASVGIAIERRRMDDELRASRDQLLAVFENVDDGITVLDRQGRFVFANAAAARLCGFGSVAAMLATPTRAIMSSFELFDRDGHRLAPEELPARRVLAGEPQAELLVRSRGREPAGDRWSNVRATPVYDRDGAVRLAVSVFRDVTDERETEIREARLHAAEREARKDAERLVRRLARLEAIAEVALRSRSLDDLLSRLLHVVREALDSDRATILLLDEAGDLVFRASVGIDEETDQTVRVPLGKGVAGRIAATRAPLIVDDLSKVEAMSRYLRASGSLAGVPLLFAGRLLGVLHVNSDATGAFGATDLDYLKLVAERVAIGIEQARLHEREHDIAAALQRSLLPGRLARIPGLAIAASYLPAADGARVGGDWYDAFPVGDGRALIVVGDVVGHGVGAAAAMGRARHALRAYALEDPSPARVFARLNAFLLEAASREFCTAFCALLDPWAGSVVHVNAGHPAPLVLEPAREARFLQGARSVPLGVTADAVYEQATDSFAPGTTLFAYTDGLVERRDELLDERLELLLREVAAAAVPLRRLPDAIAATLLGDGSRTDDVAILAVRLASSGDLRLRLPAEPASLAVARRALAGFLARAGASTDEVFELQVACGEACANVVEHAYGARSGLIRLHVSMTGDTITIGVRDTGIWRDEDRGRWQGRGHGLRLIRAFVDDVELRSQKPSGTEVVLVRRLADL